MAEEADLNIDDALKYEIEEKLGRNLDTRTNKLKRKTNEEDGENEVVIKGARHKGKEAAKVS